MTIVTFHGSETEVRALLAALKRACACKTDPLGRRVETCPGHRMLLEEQRCLDGLICNRRRAAQLWDQEMTGCP